MISVQGVGETVSVVKYNVLDTKGGGGGGGRGEGDSPVRVIPSVGIENEIWSICEFFRKSFFPVASPAFWYWGGGGGEDPQMYRQKTL